MTVSAKYHANLDSMTFDGADLDALRNALEVCRICLDQNAPLLKIFDDKQIKDMQMLLHFAFAKWREAE